MKEERGEVLEKRHTVSLVTMGRVSLVDPSGDPIPLQPKRLALLVYLAVAPPRASLRRDQLLAMFWPDLVTEQARGLLRQALKGLRQVLPDGVLITRGEEVTLDHARFGSDVWDFEEAIEDGDLLTASGLYAGRFLDGFHVSNCREFERWVAEKREEVDRAGELVLQRLASKAACDGDWFEAIRWYRTLIEHDPYSTRVTLGLMKALVATGDRASALRCADSHGSLLQSDLNAAPSPAVKALADELRLKPQPQTLNLESVLDHPGDVPAALAERYSVVEEVGRGATSTVFLARDLRHERQVAIKVLRPEVVALLGAESFVREIKLTASLNHPHILPLLDSGMAGGLPYYVMPFLEGESLRAKLKGNSKLVLEEVIQVAYEVADALEYAHQNGVVHCDIKPDNILISGGHAVVADFGIARAIRVAGEWQGDGDPIAAGTPLYMSPEQTSGDGGVDGRSDLYSLGCVVLELLSWSNRDDQRFAGTSKVHEAEAEERLRKLMETCRHSDVEERLISAGSLKIELDEIRNTLAVHNAPKSIRRRWVMSLGLVATLAVIALGTVLRRNARISWVYRTALPRIEALHSELDLDGAYRVWSAANAIVPNDPQLAGWAGEVTRTFSVASHPTGAEVHVKGYLSESDWLYLGKTPIESTTTLAGAIRFRLTLPFHDTLEAFRVTGGSVFSFQLVPTDSTPPQMVYVSAGTHRFGDRVVTLGDYWLDEREVSNQDFRDFVEADGYARGEFWTLEFTDEGRELSSVTAYERMSDQTGHRGPATWSEGTFPEGQEGYPVGGVSWYEATAYCAFRGKVLPSVFHWRRASGLGTGFNSVLAEAGNMEGPGPAPTGIRDNVSAFGARDMAGNVREWVFNQDATSLSRYLLGGAWDDPFYMISHADASSPWDRNPRNGFRCARYNDAIDDEVVAPVTNVVRDYLAEEPVSDSVFALYRERYVYDSIELDAMIEQRWDTSSSYVEERVTFNAAYSGERMIGHLFLPKNAIPPYQTIVYYPALSSFEWAWEHPIRMYPLRFVIESGRAVFFPWIIGTYTRKREGLGITERRIKEHQDLSRSVDYLITRLDIDSSRIAFYGNSSGGIRGPIFTALDNRYRASVLLSGGFSGLPLPERDPFHFAPRSVVPTMMIHGRWDAVRPVATHAGPMFEMLGTPDSLKRLVLVEAGHILPLATFRDSVLAWFDSQLGVPHRR